MDIKKQMSAIRSLTPDKPEKQSVLTLSDVEKGGYVDFNKETWLVADIYYYLDVKWKNFKLRKSNEWVTELKLFSLNTGKETFVEYEIDDGLKVYQTDREVKLREVVFDGSSIKHSLLEMIADNEEGTVSVDGTSFHYVEDDTCAYLFTKDKGNTDGLPMRAYEFESSDDKYLTIEAWQEDGDRPDREAFLSHEINNSSFHVLQKKGNI